MANMQLGAIAWMATADDTAAIQWVGAIRYFPKEQDSVRWLLAGATDSTTTDSADTGNDIDTIQFIAGDGTTTSTGAYVIKSGTSESRIHVTAWADSMQHGYGSSPDKNTKWGNALLLRFTATQAGGNASSRTLDGNNVFPRQASATLSTELHVWATDTTTAVGGIKPRRRKLIETGEVDSLPPATLPSWERETRKVFVDGWTDYRDAAGSCRWVVHEKLINVSCPDPPSPANVGIGVVQSCAVFHVGTVKDSIWNCSEENK
jgi:hypothetical protein